MDEPEIDDLTARQLVSQLRRFGAETTSTEAKAGRQSLPRSVRESLSAFANTPGGGTLILGVDERQGYDVVGVDDPGKVQHDLASMCRDDVVPPLAPPIEIAEVDGRAVIIARVRELDAAEKPCYVSSLGMNRGSFLRVADGDRRLTSEEVAVLVAERGQPKFDAETVGNSSVDDLDPELVASYVSRLRRSNPRAFGQAEVDEVLLRTNVLRVGDDGSVRPTIAGLLALGIYPQQFLPQLNVTFVHYADIHGTNSRSAVRFLDNVSVDGSIPAILEALVPVVNRNMSRRALITDIGRRDMWDYPPEALREAIVNALVHRDLSPGSRGNQVQVEMFPDRLVVKNSGGLFGSVDITSLGEVSSARNSFLLRILEDVFVPGERETICENRGSGIRRMRQALQVAGMGVPVFRDKVTRFEVELPNHSLFDEPMVGWLTAIGRQGLKDSQCTALALMKSGEVFDNAKYRAATGISDSRVATFELQDLVARELIEQHGNRAGARYTLSPYASSVDPAEPGSSRVRPDRRKQVLEMLALRREASKSEISDFMNASSKTAEHWLRILRAEGMVEPTASLRGNRSVRYRLSAKARHTPLFDDESEGS